MSDPGPLIPPSRPMTAEQIGEFRERLEAAVKNPGPLKVLSPELTDAGLLEAAAAALERRYPGTRPESLQQVISTLWSVARSWR